MKTVVKKTALRWVLAAAGLVALYAALRPGGPADAVVPYSAAAVVVPASDSVAVSWILSVDEPAPTVVTARIGQRVALEVRSSRSGSVAVHGATAPELAVHGARARMSFVATAAGPFAVHFHGTDSEHLPLGVLEVRDEAHASNAR